MEHYPVLTHLLEDVKKVRPEKVKIGVVPTLRKVFGESFGRTQFDKLVLKITNDPRVLMFSPLNVGVQDGIIYAGNLDQIEATTRYFLGQKIDGLLVTPLNYGDEEAAAKIAAAVHKALGVPVYTYIWPDAPVQADGKRLSDNECGIFPMRQLMRTSMGKNPAYFPFCEMGTSQFSGALDRFIRVCSGIHAARNVRLLQIGADEPTFYAIEGNPEDFRRRFNLRVETIETGTLVRAVRKGLEHPPGCFSDLHKEIMEAFAFPVVQVNFPQLSAILTLTLGWLVEQLKAKESNCVSIRCWDELFTELGMMVCPLNGLLYSTGVMAPCETDKPGAVASALLHGLGLGDRQDFNFFADLTRWDNGRPLWWHCGPFPAMGLRSCRAWAGCPAVVREGWIIPIPAAGLVDGPWGVLRDPVTFAQIRPDENLRLQLTALNGEICDGPPTIGTHFYTRMRDPEKAWDFVNTNPYDHHNSGRIGNLMPVLREAAPWLGLDTIPAFLDNIS